MDRARDRRQARAAGAQIAGLASIRAETDADRCRGRRARRADRTLRRGPRVGTIVAVRDDGRVLEVRDESGATREFVLNPATARFLAAGSGQGERLELLGDD